jgi:hypothetical protein
MHGIFHLDQSKAFRTLGIRLHKNSRGGRLKDKLPANLIKFRVHLPGYVREREDSIQGAFLIPYMDYELKVISGCGDSWDHVSISLKHRSPYWDEMDWIRKLFFKSSETVLQIHPPVDMHINYHPYVLHLWRAWHVEYKLPPRWMIAPEKGINTIF